MRLKSGGAMRDRTADLLRARQALSQLSYNPNDIKDLKPPLSSERKWWVWVDLNHRPHPYQGCALTTWATDPSLFAFFTINQAICVDTELNS